MSTLRVLSFSVRQQRTWLAPVGSIKPWTFFDLFGDELGICEVGFTTHVNDFYPLIFCYSVDQVFRSECQPLRRSRKFIMRSLPTIIILSRENYATVGSSPHVTVYKRLRRLAKSECCLFFFQNDASVPPLGSKAWVQSFLVRSRCTWVAYEGLD